MYFLAVPFVGLVVLSMCCVFSCCAICWSRSAADIYLLCFFLAVQLVGLKLMSMCCVFSLLCHWLVSCCCLCAVYFPCCVIGWSRAAVYVLCIFLAVSLVGLVCCLCALCFPCCVIGWSRAAVYVFVFSLLCHLLVS